MFCKKAEKNRTKITFLLVVSLMISSLLWKNEWDFLQKTDISAAGICRIEEPDGGFVRSEGTDELFRLHTQMVNIRRPNAQKSKLRNIRYLPEMLVCLITTAFVSSVSERASGLSVCHSRKFIIRYIHDTDGHK